MITARRARWLRERGRRKRRFGSGRSGLPRDSSLQAAEHDLDAVGPFVSALVVFDGNTTGFSARNVGLDALLLERVPEPCGVIAPVSQHLLRLGQIIEQGCCAGVIADLASRDEEAQGAAVGIGYRVKLGVHATLRASGQAPEIPFFTRRLEAVRCTFK